MDKEHTSTKDRESSDMGATPSTPPSQVHLVGSVPLADAEEVFHAVSTHLGDRAPRIPDGETGERANWIMWQAPVFLRNPAFDVVPPNQEDYVPISMVKLRSGLTPADVEFGSLGYAAAARASYAVFARLKAEGVIPSGTRFQVSLPTPLAPVVQSVVQAEQESLLPIYTERLLAEMDEITGALPHTELAIQWDVAVEFAILEGVWPARIGTDKAEVIASLTRLGMAVPTDVELGYHLCYGDAGHRHFVEPTDTSLLVEIANGVAATVTRPIAWVHMPVPRGRADTAYYAPLKGIKLHPETKLYLGLVHTTDGEEGTRRRIDAARQVVADFGVGTECGFGRRPAATIRPLLDLHADVTTSADGA